MTYIDPNLIPRPKPAWLIAAELKALQLRTAAGQEGGKISAFADEIYAVNAELNQLAERRRAVVDGSYSGYSSEQKAKSLAAIDTESATLRKHLDGANARLEEQRKIPAPLNALSSAAAGIVRALQTHTSIAVIQSTDSHIARAVQAVTAEGLDLPEKPAKSLKALRAEIAEVRAEAIAVKNALRPLAEIEYNVRFILGEMASAKDKLIDSISGMFARGVPVSDLVATPGGQVPKYAMGMALAAIGVDTIVKAAMEKAATTTDTALRMSAADQKEQLEHLERQLYALELSEEQALNGEPRRPNVNAAAVLLVPLEVAAAADLLKLKGK